MQSNNSFLRGGPSSDLLGRKVPARLEPGVLHPALLDVRQILFPREQRSPAHRFRLGWLGLQFRYERIDDRSRHASALAGINIVEQNKMRQQHALVTLKSGDQMSPIDRVCSGQQQM